MTRKPPVKWDTHRAAAAAENVDDLVRMGETMERALARAGMTRDAYDKHLSRHPRRMTA